MNPNPNIILLDMDGTIIGDVLQFICEWEVLRNFDRVKLKFFKQNLKSALENGLLRKGFSDFMSIAQKNGIEVFLYTASDKEWTNVIIPIIESITRYKFNRPLFTRNHCVFQDNEILKSIAKVYQPIQNSLRSKYSTLTKKVILENSILIDNNRVLVSDEKHRLFYVPTYKYTHQYDVLKHLDDTILRTKYIEICHILQRHKTCLFNISKMGFNEFLSNYYINLGHKLGRPRHDRMNDTLFYDLLVPMMENKGFTNKFVKYLNNLKS